MIFHDRLSIIDRAQTGLDDLNNPVYEDILMPVRGEVRPMLSTEGVAQEGQVVSRYRVFLGPNHADIDPSDGIRWRGRTFEVEGDVEPHMHHGRVHHVEFTMKRVSS